MGLMKVGMLQTMMTMGRMGRDGANSLYAEPQQAQILEQPHRRQYLPVFCGVFLLMGGWEQSAGR